MSDVPWERLPEDTEGVCWRTEYGWGIRGTSGTTPRSSQTT
jgi:hypothetical protein